MKKSIILFLFINILTANTVFATYQGGELGWTCLPNGNYRFHAKLYGECYFSNGITYNPLPNSLQIKTNILGLFSFNIHLDNYTDITELCGCEIDSTFCDLQGTTLSGGDGATKVYYYSSDSLFPNGITLTGTPPSTGWMFSLNMCCRYARTNGGDNGNNNAYLRAIMYPYNFADVSNCFDNSPEFISHPHTAVSNYSGLKIGNIAKDIDLDSLSYEYYPIYTASSTGPQGPLNYNAGYSATDPFYYDSQIKYETGEIQILNNQSAPSFNYSSYAIKCTAYRNGTKISETIRESMLSFKDGGSNTPPSVSILNCSHPGLVANGIDTIGIMDSVFFKIQASDLDYCSSGMLQTLYLKAYSQFFDTAYGIGQTINGATLTPSPSSTAPLSSVLLVSSDFSFKPNEHVWKNQCGNRILNFMFSFSDDHCDYPGISERTLTLILEPPPKLSAVDTLIIDSVTSSSISLTWPKVDDPWDRFDSYELRMDQRFGMHNQLIWDSSDPDDTTCFYNLPNTSDSLVFRLVIVDKCNFATVDNPENSFIYDLNSIEEEEFKNITIYPNPTDNRLNIEIPEELKGKDSDIQFFNLQGQEVFEVHMTSMTDKLDIDLSALQPGTYFIKMIIDQNIILSRVITKI